MTERPFGPGGLTISSSTEAGTVSIVLTGELDLSSAPKLERCLKDAEKGGPKRVVVDLGGLAFMDSTGLRLLLDANKRAGEQRYEFLLKPGDEAVQRVFDLTGAGEVLRFEDEAVEAAHPTADPEH